MMRKLLPQSLKLQLRLLQRRFSDWKKRNDLLFSSSINNLDGAIQISVFQEVKVTSLYENKVHNLYCASSRISQIVIQPNETFSFWKIIGNPSEANGYRKGRNIVGGQLLEAVGGGLCQLSGIMYHTALLAGLSIEERYNHTVDIYEEEDRFTPLGSDATVVYGYKDLRIRNTLNVPLQFIFSIDNGQLHCGLKCTKSLIFKELIFERADFSDRREVRTIDKNTGECIAVSTYRI